MIWKVSAIKCFFGFLLFSKVNSNHDRRNLREPNCCLRFKIKNKRERERERERKRERERDKRTKKEDRLTQGRKIQWQTQTDRKIQWQTQTDRKKEIKENRREGKKDIENHRNKKPLEKNNYWILMHFGIFGFSYKIPHLSKTVT